MSQIFLGQPCYGSIELESCDAVDKALSIDTPHELSLMRLSSSLLANCFNQLLASCLNTGGFDYFVLLHADVAPSANWLEVMLSEMELYNLDVLHAVCALKSGKGTTSTALAYSETPWQHVRRLTTIELHKLWPTFTIRTIQEQLDPDAQILLPNTGCMVLKLGPWIENFPGFEIRDRMVVKSERSGKWTWEPQSISEDWGFGYWCAANGVKVGGTSKVTTRHIGRVPFMSEVPWGTQSFDEIFFELTGRTPPIRYTVSFTAI